MINYQPNVANVGQEAPMAPQAYALNPTVNNQPVNVGQEAAIAPHAYANNPPWNNSSYVTDRSGMNIRLPGSSFQGSDKSASGFSLPRSNASGNLGFRPNSPNFQGNSMLGKSIPNHNVGGRNIPNVWLNNRFNAPN